MRYLEPDSERIGRLTVEAAFDGFAGHGDAWFSPNDVTAFAQRLNAYPLDPMNPPTLSGGVSRRGGGAYEEHVGLTVRPIGSMGQVGVEVRLRQSWPPDSPRPQQTVTLEVRATYEALRKLSTDLSAAVEARNGEAFLEGETLIGSPSP